MCVCLRLCVRMCDCVAVCELNTYFPTNRKFKYGTHLQWEIFRDSLKSVPNSFITSWIHSLMILINNTIRSIITMAIYRLENMWESWMHLFNKDQDSWIPRNHQLPSAAPVGLLYKPQLFLC